MSTQVMTAPQTQRIGALKGEILAHVMPVEVFGKFGIKKPMPRNSSETVIFRRWLPKGATSASPNIWSVTASSHQLSEGETPVADTVTAQDITVSLVEYGFVYRWSNRVEDLYEDDVPSEIKRLTGERMGLLLEMIRWGQLKACTNVFYSGTATTRATVAVAITVGNLRKVSRSLQVNQGMKITSILGASSGIGTQPVEAAYVAICHTDMENDLRALSGFIHVSEYGSRQAMHENELGFVGELPLHHQPAPRADSQRGRQRRFRVPLGRRGWQHQRGGRVLGHRAVAGLLRRRGAARQERDEGQLPGGERSVQGRHPGTARADRLSDLLQLCPSE
jgi:N4-gp56 family major capsid protein